MLPRASVRLRKQCALTLRDAASGEGCTPATESGTRPTPAGPLTVTSRPASKTRRHCASPLRGTLLSQGRRGHAQLDRRGLSALRDRGPLQTTVHQHRVVLEHACRWTSIVHLRATKRAECVRDAGCSSDHSVLRDPRTGKVSIVRRCSFCHGCCTSQVLGPGSPSRCIVAVGRKHPARHIIGGVGGTRDSICISSFTTRGYNLAARRYPGCPYIEQPALHHLQPRSDRLPCVHHENDCQLLCPVTAWPFPPAVSPGAEP